MSAIFISHASQNNPEAMALKTWLIEQGWNDVFLDFDRGIVSGDAWIDKVQKSSARCKAIIFLISKDWVESKYCIAEFWSALEKKQKLFAIVVDDIEIEDIPSEFTSQWQLTYLNKGTTSINISVRVPHDYKIIDVNFFEEGLGDLRSGLTQAGLRSSDPLSFCWPPIGYEVEENQQPRKPYRGLSPLQALDAGIFYGRDIEILRFLSLIDDISTTGVNQIVVILGASGSGKSSFLRAGVLPRLSRDNINFLVFPVVRSRQGALTSEEGFIESLCVVCTNLGIKLSRREIRSDLRNGGSSFLKLMDRLKVKFAEVNLLVPNQVYIILNVDQCEELFTNVGEKALDESELFILRIKEMIEHLQKVIVLVTIRSDLYDSLQTNKNLLGVVQSPFNLPPIPSFEFKSIIESPAKRYNDSCSEFVIEPELTKRLITDLGGNVGLPLLAFTLEQLFLEYSSTNQITLENYVSFGAVSGAISMAGGRALSKPQKAPVIPHEKKNQDELIRQLFLPHLVGIRADNGVYFRKSALKSDIPEVAVNLLERLIEQRLIVIDSYANKASSAPQQLVEVSHEAVIHQWDRLQIILNENRAFLLWVDKMTILREQWIKGNNHKDLVLHSGKPLREAKRYLNQYENIVTEDIKTFVTSSKTVHRKEKLKYTTLTIGLLVAVLLAYWSLFVNQTVDSLNSRYQIATDKLLDTLRFNNTTSGPLQEAIEIHNDAYPKLRDRLDDLKRSELAEVQGEFAAMDAALKDMNEYLRSEIGSEIVRLNIRIEAGDKSAKLNAQVSRMLHEGYSKKQQMFTRTFEAWKKKRGLYDD